MEAKKEKYRRIRGAILKLLAHQHPGPVDFKVLHFLLDDLRYTITEEELESHIVYLSGKAFVCRETRESTGVRIEMVTITPQGLDVLDGFTKDVGVDTRF
jgi:hypothetical protein